MWNINAHRCVSLARFSQNLQRLYTRFQDALAVKISLDLLKGLVMELWGLS